MSSESGRVRQEMNSLLRVKMQVIYPDKTRGWNDEYWKRIVLDFLQSVDSQEVEAALDNMNKIIIMLRDNKEDGIDDIDIIVESPFMLAMEMCINGTDVRLLQSALRILSLLIYRSSDFVEFLLDTGRIDSLFAFCHSQPRDEETLCLLFEVFQNLQSDGPDARSRLIELGAAGVCAAMIGGQYPAITKAALNWANSFSRDIEPFRNGECMSLPYDQWEMLMANASKWFACLVTFEDKQIQVEHTLLICDLLMSRDCFIDKYRAAMKAGFVQMFLTCLFVDDPHDLTLNLSTDIELRISRDRTTRRAIHGVAARMIEFLRYCFIHGDREILMGCIDGFDMAALFAIFQDDCLTCPRAAMIRDVVKRDKYCGQIYSDMCAIIACSIMFETIPVSAVGESGVYNSIVELSVTSCNSFSFQMELLYLTCGIILYIPGSQLHEFVTENMIDLFDVACSEIDERSHGDLREKVKESITKLLSELPEDNAVRPLVLEFVENNEGMLNS